MAVGQLCRGIVQLVRCRGAIGSRSRFVCDNDVVASQIPRHAKRERFGQPAASVVHSVHANAHDRIRHERAHSTPDDKTAHMAFSQLVAQGIGSSGADERAGLNAVEDTDVGFGALEIRL